MPVDDVGLDPAAQGGAHVPHQRLGPVGHTHPRRDQHRNTRNRANRPRTDQPPGAGHGTKHVVEGLSQLADDLGRPPGPLVRVDHANPVSDPGREPHLGRDVAADHRLGRRGVPGCCHRDNARTAPLCSRHLSAGHFAG